MPDTEHAISASLEDYMEAIFLILRDKQAVRAKDIADRLDVKRPSVTGALQALAREGLISYSPYDVITLTTKGDAVARDVWRRHEALKTFLTDLLGINDGEAGTTACALEHSVSRTVVDRLLCLLEFVRSSPKVRKQWEDMRNG